MRALFGQLAPDQPDLLNGNMEDAVNCIPYEQSYGPFPGPAVYSASVSGTCIGAVSTKSIAGTVYTFAGTQGSLWKESAGAANNVSRTASYTTGNENKFEFETFGNTVAAANGTDAMQFFTLDTSTRFLDMSASASAPIAHHLACIRDFMVAGRISTLENRVQWCQINNPVRWTFDVNKQADFQDLPGAGIVKKITGGEFGAVLTENSCWRMSYVGSPLIFRFDETAPGTGTNVPGSVARYQNLTFFYSGRGLMAYDGENAAPIGNGSVDEFFRDDFENGSKHNCSAVIDPVNKLYILSYPSRSGTGGANRLLIFNFAVQKWARAEISLDFIFAAMTGGYTLEGLDAVMPNIDTGTVSLDSDAWKGGIKGLAAFSDAHVLVRFDTTALTARFITGEAQLIEDGRAFVRAIRPLVEGSASTSVSAYLGSRDRLIDSVSFTSAVSLNSIGICPFRNNGRYQRLRVDVAGGFTRAYGADVNFTAAGRR